MVGIRVFTRILTDSICPKASRALVALVLGRVRLVMRKHNLVLKTKRRGYWELDPEHFGITLLGSQY